MMSLLLALIMMALCGIVQGGGATLGKGSKVVALRQTSRSAMELVAASRSMQLELDEESATLYAEVVSPFVEASSGRSCVEENMKKVQRLQLQLDRSDGRSDITPGMIATTYFEFLSTCLRTEGGAWVAPLGPLQYVGFVIDQHISVHEEERVVNVETMAERMGRVLIDLPADNDSSPEAKKTHAALDDGKLQQVVIQDCLICLVRTAVRFAIYKETLEGQPTPASDFAVRVQLPVDGPTRVCSVSKEDMQVVLACDFGDCDDELRLLPEVVASWAATHQLE